MMKRQVSVILGLALTSAALVAEYAASAIVIGPSPQPQLYITANEDYHVLDGTEITSLSESGPPDDFVAPLDAIEFRGGGHEWHVDIDKSVLQNDMGEKGLTCLDGFVYEPIFGKEAQRCDFLTRDGIVNKSDF
jgi:hypothetical protein